ncbi:hypothetical protein [Mesorhizobium hawassense]|nr:hypothetical protein [Mesorhizobium hawassense]
MTALLGYVISWLPMVLILWIYVYFGMKLVRVQRTSAAALETIARKLGDIDARLARREERSGEGARE